MKRPSAPGRGGGGWRVDWKLRVTRKSRYKRLRAARTRFGPLIRAGSFQVSARSLWKGGAALLVEGRA